MSEYLIYYLPDFNRLDILKWNDNNKDSFTYRINSKLQDHIWYFKNRIPETIHKYCYIIWFEITATLYKVVILFRINSEELVLGKSSICSLDKNIKNPAIIYSNCKRAVELTKKGKIDGRLLS